MAMRLRNYNLARLSMSALRTASSIAPEHTVKRPTGSKNSKMKDENRSGSMYVRFFGHIKRGLSSTVDCGDHLDKNSYEAIADETLESLCDKFDEMLELLASNLESDVMLASGVLTVNLGKMGIYVINKQSPNKQIWLSSPISGPKRYDYVNGTWIYKHDGMSLYTLLSKELTELLDHEVDFSCCSYAKSS